ncbi:MAG: PepSY-associated TM helix domain-containing protein, partial [Vicinamibacterales bacterium]
MRFRTILFWCHLVAGVTAGLLILLMCVTGVLLTYERQLIEWSDRQFVSTPPSADAVRLRAAALLDRAEAQEGERPTAITLRADASEPVAIAFGQRTVYADAFTGEIIGAPTTGIRDLMSTLRGWHRWLAMQGDQRATARMVTGWANVLFLFIVLSGMYLWLPRMWTWAQVRAVAFFRGGLRGRARDFNWHNAIGIWSAVPLAIVVATAMPISFP